MNKRFTPPCTNLLSIFIIIIFLTGCGKEEDNLELKFFDRITISRGDLSGWDLLTGPDLLLEFGENSYTYEMDVLKDSNDLPVSWIIPTEIAITNEAWFFRISDFDDILSNDILLETSVRGLLDNDTNPIIIGTSPITVEVHWKKK